MVSVIVMPVAVSHDVTGLGCYQGLCNTKMIHQKKEVYTSSALGNLDFSKASLAPWVSLDVFEYLWDCNNSLGFFGNYTNSLGVFGSIWDYGDNSLVFFGNYNNSLGVSGSLWYQVKFYTKLF